MLRLGSSNIKKNEIAMISDFITKEWPEHR